MTSHTETAETAGQTGPHPLLGSRQQGEERHGAGGEDDGGRPVIQRPEGGGVQADCAQLVGGVVKRISASLASVTREGGVVELCVLNIYQLL